MSKKNTTSKRSNNFGTATSKTSSKTLIDSVSTNDPLVQYLGLEEGSEEYKKAKEFYANANKINSYSSVVNVLTGFKNIGNAYLLIGIFMSIYAMKFDLNYHLKAISEQLSPWGGDWLFAIALAGGFTAIFKYSIKAILNNKIRRFELVVVIFSITSTLAMSALLYTHYRFGVRMTVENEALTKAERLNDSNSVESSIATELNATETRQVDMYALTKKSLETAMNKLDTLNAKKIKLDAQYAKADDIYQQHKNKINLKDRKKVYTLQKTNNKDIVNEEAKIAQYKKELKMDSDNISTVAKQKTKHIASIDESISDEAVHWRIFLWVIMGALELLGVMGTLAEVVSIFLVPKDVAPHLEKIEGNRNAMDMLNNYLDKLEAVEIRNGAIHIDNRLNALQVSQSTGHAQTKAITEAMASNATQNNNLIQDLTKQYNLIGV